MDVRVGLWRKLSAEELMLLICGVGEDSWESLGLQGDPTSPFWRRSALGFLWNEWCYRWNSSTLATCCEELTHWKRLWWWEGLGAGGEGDDRGWDGWMASLTRWTWVWVNSGKLVMDRVAWCAAVHGIEKGQTRLRDWTEVKIMMPKNKWVNIGNAHFIYGKWVKQKLEEVGNEREPSFCHLPLTPEVLLYGSPWQECSLRFWMAKWWS